MAETIMGVLNNSEEPEWLEQDVVGGWRVWQIILLCLAGVTTLIVMVCCCFRFRIPRTKQQIEADYQRRLITSKFREKLETIQDSKMDNMSLSDVLEILHEKHLDSRSHSGSQESQPSSDILQTMFNPVKDAPEPAVTPTPADTNKAEGLSFVKFASKIATLSKIGSPNSPTPSDTKMQF